jgi:hypothetical protein
MKQCGAATKPFSRGREDTSKQSASSLQNVPSDGPVHVGPHRQSDLPAILRKLFGRGEKRPHQASSNSRHRVRQMREDFTSFSFLVLAIVGLLLLCSGLITLAFGA